MLWYVAYYEESGKSLIMAEDDADAVTKAIAKEAELGKLLSVWEMDEFSRLIY